MTAPRFATVVLRARERIGMPGDVDITLAVRPLFARGSEGEHGPAAPFVLYERIRRSYEGAQQGGVPYTNPRLVRDLQQLVDELATTSEWIQGVIALGAEDDS
ncbi:MAG: hypothetical protein M0014_12165 [Actinomycetota bacterium]|jgi:hypothetical protein|nr:hypothetical protein [Actinomycetota bacterium]